MYNQKNLDNILLLNQRQNGYSLSEDDHLVVVNFKDSPVARFSAFGANPFAIRKAVDDHWNKLNSGIEFANA